MMKIDIGIVREDVPTMRVTVTGKSGHPIVLVMDRWPGSNFVTGFSFWAHWPGNMTCNVREDGRCHTKSIIPSVDFCRAFREAQIFLSIEPVDIVVTLLNKHAAYWDEHLETELRKHFEHFTALSKGEQDESGN